MIKLLLLCTLFAAALAGYAQNHGHGHQTQSHHGWGWSSQHGGNAVSTQVGGYGHGHGQQHGHGWHRRPYHGWANVNVWQSPHGYQYGLNENGKGYNKYVWAGADYHNSHPVSHHGHGWGHDSGYQG